jgi:hypothetical protein
MLLGQVALTGTFQARLCYAILVQLSFKVRATCLSSRGVNPIFEKSCAESD